jgi:D-alanine-D-alanine ligase-like ATP-grasp enzyme
MKHLVFVDGNRQAFDAMDVALAQGHRVTFLRSTDLQLYPEQAFQQAAGRIHQVINLPSTTDPGPVVEAVTALHRATPVNAVVGLLEFSIVAAAAAAAALGLPGPAPDAVALTRDKGRVRERLDAAGIASAGWCRVRSAEEAAAAADRFGYPVILKPPSGAASLMTRVVDRAAAMAEAWEQVERARAEAAPSLRAVLGDGMLVEERLQGRMVSVEMGRRGDATLPFMVSGRRRSQSMETEELGISMPADLDRAAWQDVLAYAAQVITALGLDQGIFHIEVMLTGEGPRLVEANPRLMGGSMPQLYRNLTGHSIFQSLFALLLGDPVPVPDPQGFGGIASMRIQAGPAAVLQEKGRFGWLEEYRSSLKSLELSLPDAVPAEIAANAILGRFQVAHASTRMADHLAGTIASRFGEALGIQLKT